MAVAIIPIARPSISFGSQQLNIYTLLSCLYAATHITVTYPSSALEQNQQIINARYNV
jgi:hypothetical protein